MRSPFHRVTVTISEVLAIGEALVEASQGNLARLDGIMSAIQALKLDDRAIGANGERLRIDVIEGKVSDLTLALAEGIQRVQRSENRVRHIVAGAKRELAEAGFSHPGVDAEATELRQLDGAASEEEELPAMPESVAADAYEPSPVPGVSMSMFRRSRTRR